MIERAEPAHIVTTDDSVLATQPRWDLLLFGVTLALSTGLLFMLMRSSSIWGVALSALPMWRRVDPLAVLAITPEERRKLERDLREAEQSEDTAGAGLARMLDQTRPAEEGHAAETDTVAPNPVADPERPSESA